MNIYIDRAVTDAGEPVYDPLADVIQSRVHFRRRLAEKITIEIIHTTIMKGTTTDKLFSNVAQFIEDLANAVAERIAAREDKELSEQVSEGGAKL